MLVTPLRDGMNLVAKEYVATKHKDAGVLVLSEMAGVATELPEAVMVNPNNTMQVAESIELALNMPLKEQKTRMRSMQSRISEYTIDKWAGDFVNQLSLAAEKQEDRPKLLEGKPLRTLITEYKKANNRLILLDYDGTLKEFVKSPDEELAKPSARLKKLLRDLTKDKRSSFFC